MQSVWHMGETPADIHFEQPDGKTQLSRMLQINPLMFNVKGFYTKDAEKMGCKHTGVENLGKRLVKSQRKAL
jgi:predicted nucleic acid-binding Zn ribbon protein